MTAVGQQVVVADGEEVGLAFEAACAVDLADLESLRRARMRS